MRHLGESKIESAPKHTGFTLPQSLTDKAVFPMTDLTAEVKKLSKRVNGLSVRQSRPRADNSLDPHVIAKLSQRFQSRLKICEKTSSQVEKAI